MVLYLSVIYKMIQYFLSLIILVVVAHKHTLLLLTMFYLSPMLHICYINENNVNSIVGSISRIIKLNI